jgi:hypothetical protein
VAGPFTLEVLARHIEDLLVRIERIPDGDLRTSVAPASGQHDDIGVFEESECGVTEPWCVQAIPIQPGVLRLDAEIARKFDQARDGQGFAVDDITAMDRPDLAALPAQLEETRKNRIARGKRFR